MIANEFYEKIDAMIYREKSHTIEEYFYLIHHELHTEDLPEFFEYLVIRNVVDTEFEFLKDMVKNEIKTKLVISGSTINFLKKELYEQTIKAKMHDSNSLQGETGNMDFSIDQPGI